MFDPNVYAQLAASAPAAAAQYLATFTAPQAAPAAAPVSPPVQAQPNIQQGFAQQAAAPPQAAAARGTLEDFFNQPSGGGGPSVTSKFFGKRQQGSWLQLTVLADVTNADVQHQKTPAGVLQYFKKNGQDDLTRPKLVLVVKVQVTGSSDGTHVTEFPDGQASLWLKKGPVTDDLIRAMTAAGDPSGYPKAGAQMVMQSSGELASRTVGFSATKLYTFQYACPAGSQEELQAIAQAASGFPTATLTAPAAPAVPTVSAPAAAPAPVTPAPAVSSTVISAAPVTQPVTPPPAPVVSAPVLAPPSTPTPATVPEASFTPPPAPVVADDPKAAERAALLARLQGANQ
jgi:hypothetical protein